MEYKRSWSNWLNETAALTVAALLPIALAAITRNLYLSYAATILILIVWKHKTILNYFNKVFSPKKTPNHLFQYHSLQHTSIPHYLENIENKFELHIDTSDKLTKEFVDVIIKKNNERLIQISKLVDEVEIEVQKSKELVDIQRTEIIRKHIITIQKITFEKEQEEKKLFKLWMLDKRIKTQKENINNLLMLMWIMKITLDVIFRLEMFETINVDVKEETKNIKKEINSDNQKLLIYSKKALQHS